MRIITIEEGYDALLSTLFNGYNKDTGELTQVYFENTVEVVLDTIEKKRTFVDMLMEFAIEDSFKDIIYKRYGLTDGKALTLKELGDELGVSNEHVRTKIKGAFRKIKHVLNVTRVADRFSRI